jgi:hypothetical protein
MVRLHKRAIPAMKRLKHETFIVIRNSASGQEEMFREITLAGVGPQNLSPARYSWRGSPPGAKLSLGSTSIALWQPTGAAGTP